MDDKDDKMEDIILAGFGGHARSVIDCIERGGRYHIIGYTDIRPQNSYREFEYLGTDSVLKELHEKIGVKKAFVTVGYMGKDTMRQAICRHLIDIGYELPAIIDPSAVIAQDVVVGKGTFIGKGAIVNSNVHIGSMAIINTAAVIEHDCYIGDYSHISVGAALCGNVKIGRESFIGAKSVVIQEINIGSHVVIGAGSIVLTDIQDNIKAAGTVKFISNQ